MRIWKRTGTVALVAASLIVGSGVGMAQPAETETDTDTLFSFGYDLVNHILIWNVSALGSPYVCDYGEDAVDVTYGDEAEDGSIPVEGVEDDGGAISFEPTPEEDLDEGVEPADGPAEYSGPDGPCGLDAGEVSGPNGQVNHGMFMKLFNSLYQGQNRGCVIRHLAQSDLGKGDQQVKVGEAVESVDDAETGTVEFVAFESECEKGKPDGKDKPDKPDKPGKPDSPGKSGSAPGQNK